MVDGTGVGTKKIERWSTKKIERWSTKKKDAGKHHAYHKLHARTDNDRMTVEDYTVTKGTAGDSPAGKRLLRRRDPGAGDTCMDAAYLSRDMCNLVDELGRDPYIWPKKNTVHNTKGSPSWASMVRLFEDDPDEFMLHYHARSTVESVFNAIRTRYGNALLHTNRISQRHEIGLRVICHNINTANKLRVASRLGLYCSRGRAGAVAARGAGGPRALPCARGPRCASMSPLPSPRARVRHTAALCTRLSRQRADARPRIAPFSLHLSPRQATDACPFLRLNCLQPRAI